MYHHTQPASLIVIGLLIGLFILLLVGWVAYRDAAASPDPEAVYVTIAAMGFAAFLMVIILLLFHSLTVYEDHDSIRIKFGAGILNKRIPFAEITSCETVKNPWYYGWGIRKIPGGMMWNVSGLGAVELTLKGGKKFRIGTDRPEALAEVINARIGYTPSQEEDRWKV